MPLKDRPPSRILLRGVLWGLRVVLGTLRHPRREPGPLPVEVEGTSVSTALKGNLPLREFHSDTYTCQLADSIHAAPTIPNSLARSGVPFLVAEQRGCLVPRRHQVARHRRIRASNPFCRKQTHITLLGLQVSFSFVQDSSRIQSPRHSPKAFDRSVKMELGPTKRWDAPLARWRSSSITLAYEQGNRP